MVNFQDTVPLRFICKPVRSWLPVHFSYVKSTVLTYGTIPYRYFIFYTNKGFPVKPVLQELSLATNGMYSKCFLNQLIETQFSLILLP